MSINSNKGVIPTKPELDKLISIASTEPESIDTKIWIDEDTEEVEVPTIQELNAVNARIDNIVSNNTGITDAHINSLIDAKLPTRESLGIVTLSQEEYDAIPEPDPNTLYFTYQGD